MLVRWETSNHYAELIEQTAKNGDSFSSGWSSRFNDSSCPI